MTTPEEGPHRQLVKVSLRVTIRDGSVLSLYSGYINGPDNPAIDAFALTTVALASADMMTRYAQRDGDRPPNDEEGTVTVTLTLTVDGTARADEIRELHVQNGNLRRVAYLLVKDVVDACVVRFNPHSAWNQTMN